MKKLILLFLILFLFSCEKDIEPLFCWKCKITTTYTSTGYISITKVDSINKCNWSEKDINYYVSIKSEPVKVISGNNTMTVTSKYDCKKR